MLIVGEHAAPCHLLALLGSRAALRCRGCLADPVLREVLVGQGDPSVPCDPGKSHTASQHCPHTSKRVRRLWVNYERHGPGPRRQGYGGQDLRPQDSLEPGARRASLGGAWARLDNTHHPPQQTTTYRASNDAAFPFLARLSWDAL